VCRGTSETPTQKYACALRAKLQSQRLRVGPIQAGPKENEQAGAPSVWFEYDDGKRWLRQAVAVTSDRAISLVLSASTQEARSSHVRPFDQTLRTLRPLSPDEVTTSGPDASSARPDGGDAVVPQGTDAAPPPSDGGAILDGATPTPGTSFESAPAPKIDPVGPCSK
jgi:hypothetical protein